MQGSFATTYIKFPNFEINAHSRTDSGTFLLVNSTSQTPWKHFISHPVLLLKEKCAWYLYPYTTCLLFCDFWFPPAHLQTRSSLERWLKNIPFFLSSGIVLPPRQRPWTFSASPRDPYSNQQTILVFWLSFAADNSYITSSLILIKYGNWSRIFLQYFVTPVRLKQILKAYMATQFSAHL